MSVNRVSTMALNALHSGSEMWVQPVKNLVLHTSLSVRVIFQ